MKKRIITVLAVIVLMAIFATGCQRGTYPDETTPEVTISDTTGPDPIVNPSTGPNMQQPDVTIPAVTGTLPGDSFGTNDGTGTTAPDVTEPEVTTPAATTPAPTTPKATEPTPTTPKPTEPVTTTPKPTEPVATTPKATVPGHTHSYTGKVTKQATCTAAGTKTFTCSCGDTYTEVIKATGHNYTAKVVEPTTSAQGYTLYTCSGCGESYKDNYTDKLPAECDEHDYWHTTVYKNCQEDGYREHTCLVCGYSYRDEYDYHSPDDHRYDVDNPNEVVKATYDAAGYEKYKCLYCDHVKTVTLPQLEKIDTAALESYGRSYARSAYGYEGNSSLNASNAGYYPGVLCEITSMEDGKKHVRACVDSQYRDDKGSGLDIWGYKENGEIWRAELNVKVEATNDPTVFRIWVYYR